MLQKILTDKLSNIINYKLAISELSEIRLRKDKPIVVFVKGQPYYIWEKGLTCNINYAMYCTKEMIDDIVYKASDYSIYSVNEQIKQGYIMLDNGVRLGLCGSVVEENGTVKTIINWTSLNIRIPHQIKNISLCAFDDIVSESGVKNTLIISPPGAGKTTFLRDFLFQLSENNYCMNVCVIDERGEIAGGEGSQINLGNFCDVISYCTKKQGFKQSIRAMNPQLIVTDEIGNDDDVNCLIDAMNCGVKVIATIHASSIEELKRKSIFNKLPPVYFQRYVLLSLREGPGTYEGTYNEKFAKIVKWWSMTIVLILIIMFCFGLLGYKLAAFYINRKKFFSSLQLLLSSLNSDVVFTQDKLKNILQKNISNISSRELANLCDNIVLTLEKREKIDSSIFDDIKILKKEEKNLLYNFFSTLGRYDVFTQSKEIQTYQVKFDGIFNEANEECKKYAGLFIKLGLIVGILVCLLII